MLLAWLWWSRSGPSFDWALFARTFNRLRWGWLVLSAVFAMASYYGRALRWAVLLRPLRPNASLWYLFEATAIGFTAVVLLGRPGEFVRPYLIARHEQVSLPSQLAAWMLERIYDLLMALLIFGFALSQVQRSDVVVSPALEWVFRTGGALAMGACVICLAVLVALRNYAPWIKQRLLDALAFLPEKPLKRFTRLVEAFVEGVESTRSTSAVLALIGYSVLEWVLIAGCFLCVFQAFGDIHHFGVLDVLILMGFVSFGAVVQLPGIGGGVQVVTVVVLREMFGVPLEMATSMALVLWIITFVVVVPVGMVLAVRQGVQWGKFRKLGKEVSL